MRPNFDNFGSSVLTLFAVVTGDGFGNIMFECMQTGGAAPAVSPLFFLSYFCLVNYVVLNLFIAAVLSAFAVEKEEVEKRMKLADEEAERQRILDEAEEARLEAERNQEVEIDLGGLNDAELAILGEGGHKKKVAAPKLMQVPKTRKKGGQSHAVEIPLTSLGEPVASSGDNSSSAFGKGAGAAGVGAMQRAKKAKERETKVTVVIYNLTCSFIH